MNFKAFLFHPKIMTGISAAGFTTPTPIQSKSISRIMKGNDVMGLAQTGTGKTAAFVLPILHRLLQSPRRPGRALIIAPTRELAEQIHQAIETLGRYTGLQSIAIYGGVGIQPQTRSLKGADIVVACPGRLLDHIHRNTVDLSRLQVLVLDEADQMFDMGFFPDIRRILSHLPSDRQTLLFSATMPEEISRLAGDILQHPVKVHVNHDAPAETISQTFYPVSRHLKTALLLKLLGKENTRSVLIFTRTKHRARQLGDKLAKAGFRSTSLQGNLSQTRRQDAMNGFRTGKYQVMVATDIASRGIDVSNVSHVINYDMPSTPEAYIHRIGRTGRAERSGEAFSLITDEDKPMVRAIHKTIGKHVEQRTLADFNYQKPMVGLRLRQKGRAMDLRSQSRAGSRAGGRRTSRA